MFVCVLSQDKEALQQQQYGNKLQISALQSKLDETKHRLPENTIEHGLRQELDTAIQELQDKDQQVCVVYLCREWIDFQVKFSYTHLLHLSCRQASLFSCTVSITKLFKYYK